MKRILLGCLICFSAISTLAEKNVLMLGDEVMTAYKPELTKRVGNKAQLTFVEMPKTGKPNWDVFCKEHVYDKGYDVIHFSFGRELMLHEDGKPIVQKGDTWGIYTSLIKALKKSDAFLVGCTTTLARGKVEGYEGMIDYQYSSIFKQLLGPSGIKINDLRDYTQTRRDEMVKNDSYLPTKLGKQLMAEQVANNIFEALNEGQDPNRPRILIVGDSIVGGYYGATRNLFAGEATVYSGGTTYNDANPNWKKIVDEYIEKGGEKGWDIIQFNWGLHAVKYVDENNKTLDADKPGARIQFSSAAYLEQLERFVNELKRTGAVLVFATTTPIPEGSPGAIIFMDQSTYNEPAKKLMEKHGILVNDLYTFALPRLKEIQNYQNVHFSAYGSEQLAKQNYKVLSRLLKKKQCK